MTAYSTSLKLTLIGDGEETGTWGSTTNTNLGSLLEQAIVGQTTIIMANADYTLTNLNGTLDEARNAVLILTGNQNATYSVIVPNVPKLYVVYNNLSSSATAYIKPSGGSAFQVPNGRTMYLYTNGSQFYALDYVTYAQNLVSGGTITTGAINCTSLTSSGAIVGTTVNGTTITASTQFTGPGTGLTGSASALNIGGTALNVTGIVAVVNGGSGVTTSTGTGNNVLSNSPTLVTPLLGTPTSGNLANCTGYPAGSITGTVNLATQVTGTLAVTNGGTGVTTSTGSGNVVLSTSPTLATPILGIPQSATLTNATGLPLTTGVIGTLAVTNGGTGVTTSTGTGSVVLSSSPTLVTPLLGTPTSGNLANCTGYPSGSISGNINLATQVTGTLAVTNGGTGVTTSTGSGSVVLSTSPTLVTPLLGTPTSGNLANCTFPTLNQNTTGNAATATTVSTTVASGATGTTQTAGDNSLKIATTAYVATAVTNGLGTLGTMSTQNANSVAITGGSITGITDLAVADGGTGQSALTANNVILGNGTSPVSFVAPSTSGLALRSNGTTFTMQKLGLGMSGETWYDLTGSRAIGTTYTNSNGYPISVAVGLSHLSGDGNIYRVLVNGVGVAYETGNTSADTVDSNTFIVPPGQTYIVETLLGSNTLTFWSELY